MVVVVSTPPPVHPGKAAPLTVDPAPTADQRKRKSAAPTGFSQRDIGVSVVCMHYRVDTLVLGVCLVIFCEDILSVVDICLLLVVQEFFLCT